MRMMGWWDYSISYETKNKSRKETLLPECCIDRTGLLWSKGLTIGWVLGEDHLRPCQIFWAALTGLWRGQKLMGCFRKDKQSEGTKGKDFQEKKVTDEIISHSETCSQRYVITVSC